MLSDLFFPGGVGVRVDRLWRDGATIHLRVAARRRWARCPLCRRRSKPGHSCYERTLADLPCAGARVLLHVRVRRFFCRVRWCRRRLFAERLPELAAPFARRTAFDLGGGPGARHLAAEGALVGARTLLRLVRAAPVPPPGAVRVLEEMAALRAGGASCRAIVARVGTSERTVQRWLRAGHFPERRRRSERPGQVTRYAACLRDRWAQGCHNATRLWLELRARGFRGGDGSVAAFVAPWRGERYRHRGRVRERRAPRPSADARPTPRRVCWLLLRPQDDLSAEDQAYLTRLYRVCPQVAVAEALVEEFAGVLRARDVDGLYAWLRLAGASGLPELQGVARGLWLDREAVAAAVRLDWSNGRVESQVNRLKTTKRVMYGRAGFDLLRQRVLHAA